MIWFLEKSLIYQAIWYWIQLCWIINKYKLFGTKSKGAINSLAPSKKYIMIEEFKDELRGLKNILNEIKKTGTIERTRNK